jgi:prepilin-type N-terminal cleavage/methylation domain-containing protein/prepilin-type processing-associated H-X9-DG protein
MSDRFDDKKKLNFASVISSGPSYQTWMNRTQRRSGMTLIEMIVVMAIISILMALLLSSVQKVRATAARTACLSNARQVALATLNYHATHQGLPPALDRKFLPPRLYDVTSDGGQAWLTAVLPQLKQRAIYDAAEETYRLEFHHLPVPGEHISKTVIPTYVCPADRRTHIEVEAKSSATTCFLGNIGTSRYGTDGAMQFDRRTSLTQITDGASQTILFGERPPGTPAAPYGTWFTGWGMNVAIYGQVMHIGNPEAIDSGAVNCLTAYEPLRPGATDGCHMAHYFSLHPGGAVFGFADGSCRFLTYSLGATPHFKSMITRSDGEIVIE